MGWGPVSRVVAGLLSSQAWPMSICLLPREAGLAAVSPWGCVLWDRLVTLALLCPFSGALHPDLGVLEGQRGDCPLLRSTGLGHPQVSLSYLYLCDQRGLPWDPTLLAGFSALPGAQHTVGAQQTFTK